MNRKFAADQDKKDKKDRDKYKNRDLGTLQGQYVADAIGAASNAKAKGLISERWGDNDDKSWFDYLVTSFAPLGEDIAEGVHRGGSRLAKNAPWRWASYLDPIRLGLVNSPYTYPIASSLTNEGPIGLASGILPKNPESDDLEDDVAALYKEKIRKYQDPVKNPETGTTTKRDTPWHTWLQGTFADRDADIAGHGYHRNETPWHYWLNPFDRTGPLLELKDRLERRGLASIARPESTLGRFGKNLLGPLNLLLGGERAQQKLRRMAYLNDIYEDEMKPEVKETAKKAAALVFGHLPKTHSTQKQATESPLLAGALPMALLGLLAGGGYGGYRYLTAPKDPEEDQEGVQDKMKQAFVSQPQGTDFLDQIPQFQI